MGSCNTNKFGISYQHELLFPLIPAIQFDNLKMVLFIQSQRFAIVSEARKVIQ